MTARPASDPLPGAIPRPPRHSDVPAPGVDVVSHYSLCVACGSDDPTRPVLRVHAEGRLVGADTPDGRLARTAAASSWQVLAWEVNR